MYIVSKKEIQYPPVCVTSFLLDIKVLTDKTDFNVGTEKGNQADHDNMYEIVDRERQREM